MTEQLQQQLDDLFEFLRFPSVSTASEHAGDVRACGEWLVKKLTTMGLNVELHETPKHPVVVAKNDHQEDRKTCLLYTSPSPRDS